MHTVDLNALAVFEQVARRGSFVAAALALDLPKTTVSRRVATLEQNLGARLLQRTTRKVALTEAGRVLMEHCERIREESEAAAAAVLRLQESPRGRLVVTAPYLFGVYFLAPALPRFFARHPEMQVDVTLTEAPVDLLADAVDVSIRTGPLPSSRVTARSLGNLTRRLYASPDYLARRAPPALPGELAGHALLALRGELRRSRIEWHLGHGREVHQVSAPATLLANDLAFLLEAALAGGGIAKLPEAICHDHVRTGRLVPVLPGWSGPAVELAALYASRQGLAPKVRVFVDFLAQCFQSSGPAGPRQVPSRPVRQARAGLS